jgi:hypothetical protein
MSNEVKDGWYTDSTKPPIGIVPERTHEKIANRDRIYALCGAISRYSEANMAVPHEWLIELKRRMESLYDE